MIKKKDRYNLYGFNTQYEFNTYKKIGKDYGKLPRYEEKYTICNTYSDWEKYVKMKLPLNILNYEDFIHWLNNQLRFSKEMLDLIRGVLVPIYITLISIGIEKKDMALIICLMLLVTSFSGYEYKTWKQKADFWEDYINIAKANNPKS